jgi:hypothetical protein
MNFKQAKAKLKRLAKGKFHSINYKISEHTGGELMQECSVYIDETDLHIGETWEAAFKELNKEINPQPKNTVEIESIEEIKQKEKK